MTAISAGAVSGPWFSPPRPGHRSTISRTLSIRAAIVGPTGYTGLHLVEILLRHPEAELTYLASRRDPPPNLVDEFPRLRGRIGDDVATCRPADIDAVARAADVVFTCLPHAVAMQWVGRLVDAGVRVVDLSADYRLRDPAVYEAAYQTPHADVEHLHDAVYGLPELGRDALRGARLVANPGCYPTAAALAVAPLLSSGLVRPKGIVINASSGVTGAGRSAKPSTHYPEHNESYYAYGAIGGHRHQPEIAQTLRDAAQSDVDLLFVPHLLPVDRGILETIYLEPAGPDVTQARLADTLAQRYAKEPFVRVCNTPPNIKDVRDTNCCDLCVRLVPTASGSRVVVFSTIDNMIKGASGQAVQNMNLLFDLSETTGLAPGT